MVNLYCFNKIKKILPIKFKSPADMNFFNQYSMLNDKCLFFHPVIM